MTPERLEKHERETLVKTAKGESVGSLSVSEGITRAKSSLERGMTFEKVSFQSDLFKATSKAIQPLAGFSMAWPGVEPLVRKPLSLGWGPKYMTTALNNFAIFKGNVLNLTTSVLKFSDSLLQLSNTYKELQNLYADANAHILTKACFTLGALTVVPGILYGIGKKAS